MPTERRVTAVLVVLVSLALAACGGRAAPAPCQPCAPSVPVAAHYVDADDNSLEKYDAIWSALQRFYRSESPANIRVRYRPSGPSMFDVPSSTVVISLSSLEKSSLRATIAHESSHLFLAALTEGASTLDELRFIDEGLASVLGYEIDGQLAPYQARAVRLAAGRMKEAPITFERVARWPTFFGSGGKNLDWGAYDVGASFVFYLRDEVGDARLVDLLRSLGRTRSLEASARQVLGRSLSELESGWHAYVGKAKVDVPKLIDQSPQTLSQAVSTTRSEISVTFDVDMAPIVCLMTPCQEGICFDHARWKTERTLVVAIERPLLPKHTYRLALGVPSCRLRSRAGDELPVTEWSFETE